MVNWSPSLKSQILKVGTFIHYSRESWNVVKKKTADSEREWHSLRAEFAARRKLFKTAYRLGQCGGGGGSESEENGEEGSSSSSAESGFSTDAENANHETETEESNQLNIPSNEDIMTASTTTIKNEPVIVDDEDNGDDTKKIVASDEPSEDQNNDGEAEVQQVKKVYSSWALWSEWMCFFKLCPAENAFPQKSHLWSFLPLWTELIWFFT